MFTQGRFNDVQGLWPHTVQLGEVLPRHAGKLAKRGETRGAKPPGRRRPDPGQLVQ